jgi:hypothetical protein
MPLVTGGNAIQLDAYIDKTDFDAKVAAMNTRLDALKTSLVGQSNQIASAAKSSTTSWTEFRSMYGTVLDVVRVGGKVWDETSGKALTLAENVRTLTDVSSMSAEEASRFLQVLDDYGLSAQDALTATKALTKQGHEPSIETIAQLSSQYNSLNSVEEQNEFIIKNLGKGGLEWARVLGLGEDKLRALNAQVNVNLVLSQQQLDAAEKNRLATDELTDSWDAFTISLGNEAIPIANELLGELNDRIDESGFLVGVAKTGFDDLFRAIFTNNDATEEATPVTLEMSYALAAQAREAQASATNQYLNADSSKVLSDALSTQLDLTLRLNGATQEQIRMAGYNQLKQDLTASGGSLTQEEADILQDAGIQLGIFDQKAANAAKNIANLNKQFANDGDLQKYLAQLKAIPSNISTTVSLVNQGVPPSVASTITAGKATGGLVSAPGDGTSDTALTPIANNEYVVRASAVRKPGVLAQLDAINSGGSSGGSSGGGVSINIYGGIINVPSTINEQSVEGQFG